MKKILIILLAIAFVACSPQRQLARLRYYYPELFSDTTITENVQVTIEGKTNSILLPNDFIYTNLDSTAVASSINTNAPQSCPNADTTQSSQQQNAKPISGACVPQKRTSTPVGKSMSITAGNARATVTATDSGLVLQVDQLPDTIEKEVQYNATIARVEEKPTIAKEKDINVFFRVFGIMISIAILLILALYFFVQFIKHRAL